MIGKAIIKYYFILNKIILLCNTDGATKSTIPIGLTGIIGLIDYLYLPLSQIKTYYSYRIYKKCELIILLKKFSAARKKYWQNKKNMI